MYVYMQKKSTMFDVVENERLQGTNLAVNELLFMMFLVNQHW
jgi:hypothetical protein